MLAGLKACATATWLAGLKACATADGKPDGLRYGSVERGLAYVAQAFRPACPARGPRSAIYSRVSNSVASSSSSGIAPCRRAYKNAIPKITTINPNDTHLLISKWM